MIHCRRLFNILKKDLEFSKLIINFQLNRIIPEAALVSVLPLPVDDLEGNVLVGRTRRYFKQTKVSIVRRYKPGEHTLSFIRETKLSHHLKSIPFLVSPLAKKNTIILFCNFI